MKITTIEQEIKDTGRCLIQTVGVSMEPILHNRYSTVVIEKPDKPLMLNDVVLYRRTTWAGEPLEDVDYVLHRIVKIREDDYLICGDNCIYKEPVSEKQILGVMVGYFNGEDYVECATDAGYKRYVRSLPYRYIYRRCKDILTRTIRKIKRSLR